MTRILKLTAGATMLMLVGCMTWQPTKTQAISNSGGKYSIQLPAGWNVLTFGTQQMVTRYGMGMQQFIVGLGRLWRRCACSRRSRMTVSWARSRRRR